MPKILFHDNIMPHQNTVSSNAAPPECCLSEVLCGRSVTRLSCHLFEVVCGRFPRASRFFQANGHLHWSSLDSRRNLAVCPERLRRGNA